MIVLIACGVFLCRRRSKRSQPEQQTPANPPIELTQRTQFPEPSAPPLPTEPTVLRQVFHPPQNPSQILNNRRQNVLSSQLQDIVPQGNELLQTLDVSSLPDIAGVGELFGNLGM